MARLLAFARNNACQTVYLPLVMFYVVLKKFNHSRGFTTEHPYYIEVLLKRTQIT